MSKKKEMNIEEKLKDALIEVEEQPYQLPENWEWVRTNSIIDVRDG